MKPERRSVVDKLLVLLHRLYAPYQSGVADPHACDNIRNALSAGVIISGYMTPEPNSVKTGAEQFDEMYTNLKNNQIYLRNIWIQVTSPINWSANTTVNINFVNSILFRAEQNGINTGIFTNFYDWSQIMGSAAVSNASLWYWNTYGAGESNETPPIFEDFRPFGGWTQPTIKQFAQVETVCGAIVNRDVFVPSESVGGVVRGIEDRNALLWSLAEERIIPRKSTN
ncbi:hypothetical protein Q1695_006633 [Nippostrongylus brasiliensis]|nr:hypothetical protein Q1695_006633 [Nippostrongylus brasiliensis]